MPLLKIDTYKSWMIHYLAFVVVQNKQTKQIL